MGKTMEIDLGDKAYIYIGSKTRIYNGDTLVIEYTNIVNGDVTGDGIANIADVVKIADYTLDNSIKLWR